MERMLLICAMLCLNIVVASAQKIVKDNVDIFTKEHIVETSANYYYTSTNESPGMSCKIEKEGNNVIVVVTIAGAKNLEVSPNMKTELFTIDVNGVVKRLESQDNLYMQEKTTTSGIHWGFGIMSGKMHEAHDINAKIPINIGNATYFSGTFITNIRVKIGTNKFDYKLNNTEQKSFAKLFDLIIPYMQTE